MHAVRPWDPAMDVCRLCPGPDQSVCRLFSSETGIHATQSKKTHLKAPLVVFIARVLVSGEGVKCVVWVGKVRIVLPETLQCRLLGRCRLFVGPAAFTLVTLILGP